jgi:hypothetical protein
VVILGQDQNLEELNVCDLKNSSSVFVRISGMSSPKRFHEAETESLPVEMVELGRLIDAMKGPEREGLILAYNRVSDSVHRRRRILNLVQEALSQLRLDVKYLMFDLETTRRERDQLQAQLEDGDKGF